MNDQHDPLNSIRSEIEARVATANKEHHERCSAFPDEIQASHAILSDELRRIYAWAEKNKGKAQEAQ